MEPQGGGGHQVRYILLSILIVPTLPLQSRVYLPMVQQPCPCTCPSSTTTTTAKPTTTTLIALGYLEWFHTEPNYIVIPASGDPQVDQVFQITGSGFGPAMKAYLPMIGRSYYDVTITSRTTGWFILPYADQTTTGDRDEMKNIYAMLFDQNGRSSDIHSLDIIYK